MKLAEARVIAMSLPGVTEEPHHEYTSFRVKGKIFSTAPPTGEHLHIFVTHAEREHAVDQYPGVVEKLWWGGKVRGLRVALRHAKKPMIAELLTKAWSHKAPKSLLSKMQHPP
jgi:hypothetical protein